MKTPPLAAHLALLGAALAAAPSRRPAGDPVPRGEDPVAYLDRRILRPIGVAHGAWRRGRDGNPQLPSGTALTARDWARFGELVRLGGTWEGKTILLALLPDPAVVEGRHEEAFLPGDGLHHPVPVRAGDAGAAVGEELLALPWRDRLDAAA